MGDDDDDDSYSTGMSFMPGLYFVFFLVLGFEGVCERMASLSTDVVDCCTCVYFVKIDN